MSQTTIRKCFTIAGLLATAVLLVAPVYAATPGIASTTLPGPDALVGFSLNAEEAFISQPDGSMVYSWGYGCLSTYSPTFLPSAIVGGACPTMQIPGPTLIVTEGQDITVTLRNNLPLAAGNTSILFPGFDVTASGGVAGLLTMEATHLGTVTYKLKTGGKAGTHAYYSGTQGDLQVEMGLYGTIVVLPAANLSSDCGAPGANPPSSEDYRLKASAYNNVGTCYAREYLFQFSEMDPAIHRQAEEQKDKACSGCMTVRTENYHPAYFMINGRSMPDDMDPLYAVQYPHQPYNGNPHMHPGELVLLRIVGQGRWQHPFHEHGNHVRLLARDGNLITSQTPPSSSNEKDRKLAGPLLFTTTTTPGQAMDGIFYWSGKGLNWDVYGHFPGDGSVCTPNPTTGYYTANPAADNYFEWCADHNKPVEANPAGTVGSGGPVTLPDPLILAAGPWYGGSPYLGPDATARSAGYTPISPAGTVANDPGTEAGFAFMWHSHNEREITTNNAFPGGMLMMMLVDPYTFSIDESK